MIEPNSESQAEALLRAADEQNLLDEARRAEMLRKIADYRWTIATTHHRLENGEPLDFERWPFQVALYKDASPDLVIYGSAGWGKTEWALVDSISKSVLGLRVIFVTDKSQKRDNLVLGRLDPAIHSIPFYKAMLRGAQEDRAAEVDSARFKHFGDGSINFLGANAPGDFQSYRADSTIVDEHQLCDQKNIRKLFSRRTGSFYRFRVLMGNPLGEGTSDNQNLDWEYKQGTQFNWSVPCPYCGIFQVLGWWSHFIEQETNEFGAILSVRPKDTERKPDGVAEIRPICTNCQRPMRRLVGLGEGDWIATHPGRRRHSYRLSNLYNPDANINEMFEFFLTGLNDPQRMADFVHDQLGMPHGIGGVSITSQMLESVSTGRPAGVAPYRVIPADQILWRDLEAV